MQVSSSNFFIHPESNLLYEQGIKREVTFSSGEGTPFYKQIFPNKFVFLEFINTYCTPWRKKHPLLSLFQKSVEGMKAIEQGIVMASACTIEVIIHEELLNPYTLDDTGDFFHFFKALIKTKNQYFQIHTKGLTKKSIITSVKEYEYNGLKSKETGETFPVELVHSIKRKRSTSLP